MRRRRYVGRVWEWPQHYVQSHRLWSSAIRYANIFNIEALANESLSACPWHWHSVRTIITVLTNVACFRRQASIYTYHVLLYNASLIHLSSCHRTPSAREQCCYSPSCLTFTCFKKNSVSTMVCVRHTDGPSDEACFSPQGQDAAASTGQLPTRRMRDRIICAYYSFPATRILIYCDTISLLYYSSFPRMGVALACSSGCKGTRKRYMQLI